MHQRTYSHHSLNSLASVNKQFQKQRKIIDQRYQQKNSNLIQKQKNLNTAKQTLITTQQILVQCRKWKNNNNRGQQSFQRKQKYQTEMKKLDSLSSKAKLLLSSKQQQNKAQIDRQNQRQQLLNQKNKTSYSTKQNINSTDFQSKNINQRSKNHNMYKYFQILFTMLDSDSSNTLHKQNCGYLLIRPQFLFILGNIFTQITFRNVKYDKPTFISQGLKIIDRENSEDINNLLRQLTLENFKNLNEKSSKQNLLQNKKEVKHRKIVQHSKSLFQLTCEPYRLNTQSTQIQSNNPFSSVFLRKEDSIIQRQKNSLKQTEDRFLHKKIQKKQQNKKLRYSQEKFILSQKQLNIKVDRKLKSVLPGTRSKPNFKRCKISKSDLQEHQKQIKHINFLQNKINNCLQSGSSNRIQNNNFKSKASAKSYKYLF